MSTRALGNPSRCDIRGEESSVPGRSLVLEAYGVCAGYATGQVTEVKGLV